MSEVYYGTKRITAEPQEKEGNHGYGVVYEDGYKSWSPRSTFEDAYRKNGELNFGHALMALNEGRCIARSGWNGKNQFIFRRPGGTIIVHGADRVLGRAFAPNTRVECHPYLAIKSAQGTVAPWVASQTDLLAEDWMIVE